MRVKDTALLSLGDWKAIGDKKEDKLVKKIKIKA